MKSSAMAVTVAVILIAAGTGLRASDEREPAGVARVRIRLSGEHAGQGRRLTGTLAESGPDTVVLVSGKERLTIERADIRKIEVSRGRHRAKGALLGAAVGLGVGLTLSGAEGASCDGFDCLGAAALLVVVTPALTVTGAGIGAAVGTERWEPVEASRRPHLSLAPTAGRGVGARLAFSF
jgi:hypothetical protein